MMSFRSILLWMAVLVLGYLVYTMTYPYYSSISLEIPAREVRTQRFAYVIDVRTPKEREEYGYYPNSIPIELHQLETQVPMDIGNRDLSLLIYGDRDDRAEKAAQILYRMGYSYVRFLRGSYQQLMPGQLEEPIASYMFS